MQSLQHLHDKEFYDICGKFHAHVSVAVKNATEDTKALEDFCRAQKGTKLTVIDLYNFSGRQQSDYMLTKHYQIPDHDAVHKIIDDLEALADDLIARGFSVARIKLEHESLPTLPTFDREHYREVHIKLRTTKAQYSALMELLKANAATFGYVPSSNPRAIEGDVVHQFINVRYYEGTLDETNKKIGEIKAFLQTNHVDIEEVKAETAVFDTNLDLDKWWA